MAQKTIKTEHSGSKKGSGSYWGRKKDAKKESNKKRRAFDKSEVHDIRDRSQKESNPSCSGCLR